MNLVFYRDILIFYKETMEKEAHIQQCWSICHTGRQTSLQRETIGDTPGWPVMAMWWSEQT